MYFYAPDWRSDPELAMCSEGARLLWFEMLLLMNESKQRGFLLVSGKKPSPQQIAMLTRTSVEHVEDRLSELSNNGVYSTDRRGFIYSRKMVREEKKRRIARENGKKGGNPKLCEQTEKTPLDNQQDNRQVKLSDVNASVKSPDSSNPVGTEFQDSSVARKPSARFPVKSKLPRNGRRYVYPDEFLSVWKAYEPCMRDSDTLDGCYGRWREAVVTDGYEPGEILQGVMAWTAARDGDPYMPGLLRFLRDKIFTKRPQDKRQPPPRETNGRGVQATYETLMERYNAEYPEGQPAARSRATVEATPAGDTAEPDGGGTGGTNGSLRQGAGEVYAGGGGCGVRRDGAQIIALADARRDHAGGEGGGRDEPPKGAAVQAGICFR